MEQYKGFTIEPFEERSGNWFARFKRIDGQKFRNPITKELVTGGKTPSVQYSSGSAIKFAKEMIGALPEG